MKRSGKLLMLLVVLAVLAVGAFAAIKLGEREEERERQAADAATAEPETYAVADITAEDITKISWTVDDTELAFEKKDGEWAYVKDAAFPVNQEVLETQVETIVGLTTAKEIQNTSDMSAFGFDQPQVTVTVNDTIDYVFGNDTNLMQGRYLQLGGKVYIVDYDLARSLSLTEADVLQYDEVPEMAYVLEYKADSEPNDFHVNIIYVLQDDEGNGTFFVKGDITRVISQDQTNSLLNNIYITKLRDCVNYNASEADLEAYGLADPVMTIYMKFVNKAGETGEYTIHLGNLVEGSEDYRYARIPGSKMVYAYDNFIYNNVLLKTYDYLEDKAQYDSGN